MAKYRGKCEERDEHYKERRKKLLQIQVWLGEKTE